MIEKLSKKQIISLNVLLLIFVVTFLGGLLYIHVLVSKNIVSTSGSLEKFNQAISLKRFDKDEITTQLWEKEEINRQIDSLIVDGYNIVEFFSFLEKMASESGVSINISNVEITKDYNLGKNSKVNKDGDNQMNDTDNNDNELGLISVETSIVGQEGGVIKFLKLFENSPFVITIHSATLKEIRNN